MSNDFIFINEKIGKKIFQEEFVFLFFFPLIDMIYIKLNTSIYYLSFRLILQSYFYGPPEKLSITEGDREKSNLAG